MSTIDAATPSQEPTTQELQEQVWDLKESLEDAHAQMETQAGQLQRLRTESRNKDRELNELKSIHNAAFSDEIQAKDARIAELRSKDHLIKEKANALQTVLNQLFNLVQAETPGDPSIKGVQRPLTTVGHDSDHLPLGTAHTFIATYCSA